MLKILGAMLFGAIVGVLYKAATDLHTYLWNKKHNKKEDNKSS